MMMITKLHYHGKMIVHEHMADTTKRHTIVNDSAPQVNITTCTRYYPSI